MSIIENTIPSAEQITEMLPEQNIYVNSFFNRRNIQKSYANGNNLIGSAANSKGQTCNFKISANNNSLINLDELSFNIKGTINISLPAGGYTNNDTLRCSQMWFLNLFNQLELKIGGTSYQSIQQPQKYAQFRANMAANWLKMRAGQETSGFHASYTDIIGNIDNTGVITNTMPAAGQIAVTSPSNYPLINYDPSIQLFKIAFNAAAQNMDVSFDILLPIHYLFDVDTIKPIYNQTIEILLTRSGENHCSLYTPIVTADAKYCDLVSFEEFSLNTIYYEMNNKFKELVENIYKTPQIQIISMCDMSLSQTITNFGAGSNFQANLTSSNNYNIEYVYIDLPKAISNTFTFNNNLSKDSTLTNARTVRTEAQKLYRNSAPHSNAIMPLKNINFSSGGFELLNRDFTTSKMITNISSIAGRLLLNSHYLYTSTDLAEGFNTAINSYNYSFLYDLYLYCRRYHNMTEETAMNIDEFYNLGFCICIPAEGFQEITSNSQMTLNLTWNEYTNNSLFWSYTLPGAVKNIFPFNTLNIITKGKRVIQFTGPDRVEMRNITNNNFQIQNSIEVKS